MSKIGKKYNLFSEGAVKAEKLYLALKELEKNNIFIEDITEFFNNRTSEYNGAIILKLNNRTEPTLTNFANLVSSSFFNDYKDFSTSINFTIDTHYESLVELKKSTPIADSQNIYKFEAPFEYNFLVKNYEDYVKANADINETGLPYFYQVLSDFVTKDNFSGFSGSDFFEKPENIIYNQRTALKTNVIPSQVLVENKAVPLDEYINKFFIYKSQFPFYADIKFDTHELDEKSIIGILNEKDLSDDLMVGFANQPATSSLYFSLTKKVPPTATQLIRVPTRPSLNPDALKKIELAKDRAIKEISILGSSQNLFDRLVPNQPATEQLIELGNVQTPQQNNPVIRSAKINPAIQGKIQAIEEKGLEVKEINPALKDALDRSGILEKIFDRINTTTGQEDNNLLSVNETNVEAFLLNQLRNATVNADFTFIASINQAIDGKSRSFLEILTGQNEYIEVIGYRLKKSQVNEQTRQPYIDPIQEWYLPNVFEGQLNWVDSQIKYNKLYSYKLDPIVLTFATDFKITSIRRDGIDRIVLEYVNIPKIKAYVLNGQKNDARTTLGATYINKLLDSPPLEPEVEIVPFIGVDNQVKLNFNTSIGKKTVPYIVVNNEELVKVKELQTAQNIEEGSNLLTYASDEPSTEMEVYRLDVKPKAYQDFFNSKLETVSTNGTAGASLITDIEPNKKYYYVARCKDYHGNFSNPTPVYEVEMLSENGLIIPNITLVDFDKDENKKQMSKSFKRYLKIQPAIRHRLVNDEKVTENDIELGDDNIKPWNKRFKLRIISKATGKKMDVNFVFKYNKPQ